MRYPQTKTVCVLLILFAVFLFPKAVMAGIWASNAAEVIWPKPQHVQAIPDIAFISVISFFLLIALALQIWRLVERKKCRI